MKKGELLYEGKAKRMFHTDDENIILVEFKDSATAFNGEKKAEITGKGSLNNQISTMIFEKLTKEGIANHFVEKISEREQLVRKATIIPLEVVVRNVIAGSLSKRLGVEEGVELEQAIVEYYYKDDALGDPIVTEDHIDILNIATKDQLAVLKERGLKINDILKEYFSSVGVKLVDFKLEFGFNKDGEIILADEISPDNCRLWDMKTNEKMDKDVFRRGLGDLVEVYEKILARLSE